MLAARLDAVELARGHEEDLLQGVLGVGPRQAEAHQGAPDEAEVLGHQGPDPGRHLGRRVRRVTSGHAR